MLCGPNVLTLVNISNNHLSFLFSSIMCFLRSSSIIVTPPCLVALMWKIWWGSRMSSVVIVLISAKGFQTISFV